MEESPIRFVVNFTVWWSDHGHAWIAAGTEFNSMTGVQKISGMRILWVRIKCKFLGAYICAPRVYKLGKGQDFVEWF